MISPEDIVKSLKRINWFFIGLGMLEIFLLVFLTQNFLFMLYGLITLVPAYIALSPKHIKWNYFVGIWTLIQFNPLTGLAMIGFILGDFFKPGADRAGDLFDTIFAIVCILIFAAIVISSFILGILLISKTSKYNKLIKAFAN
ncbi:hypothetical protein BZG01_07020 [Labilibaculum manganireducens]|uniref:Uncharacterized protein n=1 Tax=Labilibaculum manganireducens TaxID=1940525 RepID=A0A2N3IB22_9BACT|nr:hypothetical protein [Labilibaculum manganireducens]PKQ67485.1 hypothetical protein BZG01_07020 [Labilibaculum manganireducens]